MLNDIYVQELSIHLCIHLSYLEEQRHLKIYNKTYGKKTKTISNLYSQ